MTDDLIFKLVKHCSVIKKSPVSAGKHFSRFPYIPSFHKITSSYVGFFFFFVRAGFAGAQLPRRQSSEEAEI